MWLHGDLHPANVVIRDGMLTGVIDFGKMGAGDPATVTRARGWAVLVPWV
nr:phosphotransferase [Rhodococcus sp. JVH1]